MLWCKSGVDLDALRRVWPAAQAATAGSLKDRILAQWSDRFQCHVAGALHGPFIVLLVCGGCVMTKHRANSATTGELISPQYRLGRVERQPLRDQFRARRRMEDPC